MQYHLQKSLQWIIALDHCIFLLQLQCCGATGPQDYYLSNWYNYTKPKIGINVPPTCCGFPNSKASMANRMSCQSQANFLNPPEPQEINLLRTTVSVPLLRCHTPACWLAGLCFIGAVLSRESAVVLVFVLCPVFGTWSRNTVSLLNTTCAYL